MFTMVIEKEYKKNHRIITPTDVANAVYHYGKYFIILHDKDTLEDGTLKHEHYHVIIQSKTARKLESILSEVSSSLKVPDNLITIASVNDLMQNIRYLVHADDCNKYQYEWASVWCNSFDLLEDAQNYVSDINTRTLISVLKQSNNYTDVIKRIGLDNFKKYLAVIKTLMPESVNELSIEELVRNQEARMDFDNADVYGINKKKQSETLGERIKYIEQQIAWTKEKANNCEDVYKRRRMYLEIDFLERKKDLLIEEKELNENENN